MWSSDIVVSSLTQILEAMESGGFLGRVNGVMVRSSRDWVFVDVFEAVFEDVFEDGLLSYQALAGYHVRRERGWPSCQQHADNSCSLYSVSSFRT